MHKFYEKNDSSFLFEILYFVVVYLSLNKIDFILVQSTTNRTKTISTKK